MGRRMLREDVYSRVGWRKARGRREVPSRWPALIAVSQNSVDQITRKAHDRVRGEQAIEQRRFKAAIDLASVNRSANVEAASYLALRQRVDILGEVVESLSRLAGQRFVECRGMQADGGD
jgi:hypothetical protein